MPIVEFRHAMHAYFWMEGNTCRRVVAAKATRSKYSAIRDKRDS